MQGIRRVYKALGILQSEVKEDIKIQHILILIKLVFSSPDPVSYTDLGKFLNTTRASVSRNVRILGSWMKKCPATYQWVDVGLGLINVYPDLYNTRQYIAKLTKQGQELMKKIDKAAS